ncbi:MAG: hypothetical protein ABIR31_00015 [Ginsengibacter sp.]
METITIEILNNKAIPLLKDLEHLQLIRMCDKKTLSQVNWSEKYKGAMTKQSLSDIDNQLNELRNGWE